jgi:hypothetical protein
MEREISLKPAKKSLLIVCVSDFNMMLFNALWFGLMLPIMRIIKRNTARTIKITEAVKVAKIINTSNSTSNFIMPLILGLFTSP